MARSVNKQSRCHDLEFLSCFVSYLKSLCHLSPCDCLPWSWLFPSVWLLAPALIVSTCVSLPVVQSPPPACVCKPCSYNSPVWCWTVWIAFVVLCYLSSWNSELNIGLDVMSAFRSSLSSATHDTRLTIVGFVGIQGSNVTNPGSKRHFRSSR